MGACDFYTTAPGANLGEAYRAAVNEARREHGDNPYSGTISTTEGYRQAVRTPRTRSGATLYGSAHIEDAQKWGPALAVPVAEDEHFAFGKARMTVTVDPVNQYGGSTTEWEIRDAAVAQAYAKYGDSLHAVKVTPKIKNKVVITRATGRAVTRYEVRLGYQGTGTLYDTKAQALAAARKAATATLTASVRAVKFYPDTDSAELAVVRTETVSASAVLDITIATPKRSDTPISGWLFFGLAAC